MRYFLNITGITLRRELTYFIRYPLDLTANLLVMLCIGLGLAVGVASFTNKGENFLIAFLVWTLYGNISFNTLITITSASISGELSRQLVITGSTFALLSAACVSNLINTLFNCAFILLIAVLAGFSFSFDFALTVLVVFISLWFFLGLAYFYGALALIFKSISQTIELLSLLMLAISTLASADIPAWLVSILRWFPYTQLTMILSRSGVSGESISNLWSDIIILAVSSLVFLVMGIIAFQRTDLLVRRRGTLGHY